MFNLTWLYVAGIHAAIVWLLRRFGADLPKRVATLFYALVLIWFFAPLTGPYTNLATDIAQLIPPWSANAPAGLTQQTVSNFEPMDGVFQIAPWAHQVRESWLSLRPPLWNGAVGGGMPLLANMSSAGLAPIRLLVLPLPLGQLMTAEGALKVLTALTFMFLFLRRHYDAAPSTIGAIAFGFGGWMITWLHFPQSHVGAVLPALFYGIDLLAERVTIQRIAISAFAGAAVIAGAHPTTIAHTALYIVLFSAWCVLVLVRPARNAARFAGGAIVAGILAVLIAAPVIAPFLETVRKGIRYEAEKSQPDSGTPYSDLPSLIPAIQPRYLGAVPGATWGPVKTETLTGFAGFAGVAAWFGLLVLCLRRRSFRSIDGFFVTATVVIVGLIQDWPLLGPPFRAIFTVTNNHRLRLMFCFLAAAMLAAVVHHARKERVVLAATLAGGAGLLIFIFLRVPPPDAATRTFAMYAAIPSIIALFALLLTRVRAPYALAGVGVALLVELWIPFHHWNPVRPASELFPRTPLIDALLRARTDQPYRIAGIGAPLFPNTHVTFGFEDARVHDPMASVRYANVLRATMKDYDTNEYYPKFKDANASVLDFLNVKWLLTEKDVEVDRTRYALLYAGADGRVWENRSVLPRFFAARNVLLVGKLDLRNHHDWAHTALVQRLPDDAVIGRDLLGARPANSANARVTIRSASNDRYTLDVSAPRHTLIVGSVNHWPGWRIRHNGRSLEPIVVNGSFLGFIVPPGDGTVQIRYVPTSFWGGATASSLTIAALVVLMRRRRAARHDSATDGQRSDSA